MNCVLKALVKKGCAKLENFTRSDNRLGYIYLLTPKDWEEKIVLTRSFLARKYAEFDALQGEIEALQVELREIGVEFMGADGVGKFHSA